MLDVARDPTWSSSIRLEAIETFIRVSQDTLNCNRYLKDLLSGIESSGITMLNQEICGFLLKRLYPTAIRPNRIWTYLIPSAWHGSSNGYHFFWHQDLLRQTPEEEIPTLLDELATEVTRLDSVIETINLGQSVLNILEIGLDRAGLSLSSDRLYKWLSIGVVAIRELPNYQSDVAVRLRTWLEDNPTVIKRIVRFGFESSNEAGSIVESSIEVKKHLMGSRVPTDFGDWCLHQAIGAGESSSSLAQRYFYEVCRCVRDPRVSLDLDIERVERAARSSDQLQEILSSLRSSAAKWKNHQDRIWHEKNRRMRDEKRRWIDSVCSFQHELGENRAPPALLFELARIYVGELPRIGGTRRGEAALHHALEDASLVKASTKGLKDSIHRTDLPTVREVLKLTTRGQSHYLGLPIVVALEIRHQQMSNFMESLEEEKIRTVLASYHCWITDSLGGMLYRPTWYKNLLSSRRELVQNVAIECAVATLKSGEPVGTKFWEIAEAHGIPGNISVKAVLRVLERFPSKCSRRQCVTLDRLLWAAMSDNDLDDLLDIVARKLRRKSMNKAQWIRWRALELMCSPKEVRAAECSLVAVLGNENATRHLAQFLAYRMPNGKSSGVFRRAFEDLESSTLGLFVRLLASVFAPVVRTDLVGWVTSDDRADTVISYMIDRLGQIPDKEAGETLQALLDDENLEKWCSSLNRALEFHWNVRREAEFQVPSVNQVLKTLRGGDPANVEDLFVLTNEALANIASRARTSNANEWRCYWNEGKRGVFDKPKVESSCRDILLKDLRSELEGCGANVQPECHHVGNTRADIEVACREFRVPVEVKKSSDRRIWDGLIEQLVRKYTIAPETGGFGIYVVVWFGRDHQVPYKDGVKPTSPKELEKRLLERLDDGQSRKISVRVIDVTSPIPV